MEYVILFLDDFGRNIDNYSALPDVKAWKMPGAGGGGYLALVVDDVKKFAEAHPETITLTIRRK